MRWAWPLCCHIPLHFSRALSMACNNTNSLFPPASLLLFLYLCFTPLNTSLSLAADSISFNHSISGNRTITSQGGKFALGFLLQTADKSFPKYYIAIWYNNIPQVTPVWIANRETPLSDPTSSELRISSNGNLVLLNQSRSLVWSTNLTRIPSNSTVAEILDTGNLVLRDGSDPAKVFWQSFDHPTDTWLPGQKMGFNKVTGEIQRLTCWKNSGDPAPGIFTHELDPDGSNQFISMWNGTKIYDLSGLWNWNGHYFGLIPEMANQINFRTEYFSNATLNYFAYYLKHDWMITRVILGVSGQIQHLVWKADAQGWVLFRSQPKNQCDVYAVCGPFASCSEQSLPFCNCVRGFREAAPSDWDLGDRTKGCVRNTRLHCGGAANDSATWVGDKFLAIPGMGLPDNPLPVAASSAEGCESACLRNCSCTAYSYDGGCSVWHGGLLNMLQLSDGSSGQTLHLRLAASELPDSEGNKLVVVKWAVVGAVASALALMAVVLVLTWSQLRRQVISPKLAADGNLMVFRYRDLQRVTNNFSEKLGGGGFGSVFKGTLPGSIPIAVKKLDSLLRQGEKQFRMEVTTIGTIQHINLVRLRGFCSDGAQRLLVYDHMPNGSLDAQLFHSKFTALSWSTRYQIALGAARGLAYLHEECRDCIIHCDVKPENILLDASFVPKVGDFGLAKLVGRDFSRVLTTARGTVGYLAPEWISGAPITAKADVYSYGMMLLEIISGRRNAEPLEEDGEDAVYFPMLAASKALEGDVLSLLDSRLEGIANLEELDRACKVACWCIQDSEICRPSMGKVVQMLGGLVAVDVPPMPKILRIFGEMQESKSSSG